MLSVCTYICMNIWVDVYICIIHPSLAPELLDFVHIQHFRDYPSQVDAW
jgi:hypothetical protein